MAGSWSQGGSNPSPPGCKLLATWPLKVVGAGHRVDKDGAGVLIVRVVAALSCCTHHLIRRNLQAACVPAHMSLTSVNSSQWYALFGGAGCCRTAKIRPATLANRGRTYGALSVNR